MNNTHCYVHVLIAHVVHVQGDPKKHNIHSSIPDGGKWASVNLRLGVLLKAVETQPLKNTHLASWEDIQNL